MPPPQRCRADAQQASAIIAPALLGYERTATELSIDINESATAPREGHDATESTVGSQNLDVRYLCHRKHMSPLTYQALILQVATIRNAGRVIPPTTSQDDHTDVFDGSQSLSPSTMPLEADGSAHSTTDTSRPITPHLEAERGEHQTSSSNHVYPPSSTPSLATDNDTSMMADTTLGTVFSIPKSSPTRTRQTASGPESAMTVNVSRRLVDYSDSEGGEDDAALHAAALISPKRLDFWKARPANQVSPACYPSCLTTAHCPDPSNTSSQAHQRAE